MTASSAHAGLPASAPVVDLNSDLGEGFGPWTLGDDEALLDIVTSANVACGFHAGDPSIMRRVCARAVERGVAIGAQVSYRDLAGFGRRPIAVDPAELADEVLYQLGALDGIARVEGGRVAYLKPHGALYNTIVTDEAQAVAVVEAVRRYDPAMPVLGLPGSAFLRLAAEAGLTTVGEAFADRAYTPAGHLVPRRTTGAVLHDADLIAERCVQLVTAGTVAAVDGTPVPVAARSICVHGDTDGAVAIARRVRESLLKAGVTVRRFTGSGSFTGNVGIGEG
ncbi:LamB/YcsF family protein [Planosporangium thailandense]|uniref:5-oxoprolinase subunit A n=1 Tax=Planosporangium thailandense TaxID=765197 RepID=A0ABX0Y4M6_9ACTN|nr:5-oxoprolinase subunit PxpA [Planosporangium thailandense]NJC72505.1 LamB/YcsF family protein [Planosporangium thailandense]